MFQSFCTLLELLEQTKMFVAENSREIYYNLLNKNNNPIYIYITLKVFSPALCKTLRKCRERLRAHRHRW